MFSTRLRWDAKENALAALARAREDDGDVIDLTESNPTCVGLPYPTEAVRAAFARADAARYVPSPLGLPEARAAVAAEYARPDLGPRVDIDPARIAITASTSESYGFLFKLLADPGDAVLVPEPSYPLFEYLARLEGVVPAPYRLAFDGRWHLDVALVEAAIAAARGVRRVSVRRGREPSARARGRAGAGKRRTRL